MNITIVGAGNIGTQFAVHCAEKGNNVKIFGSKPEKIRQELTVVNEKNEVIHKGKILFATSDPQKAFSDAELIFVTVPAFCMEDVSNKIYPYVSEGVRICLVPGTGGGECAFKKCIDKGTVVCGMQRVPSVARLVEYGNTVKATGYRDELFVSAIPKYETKTCAEIIGNIFDMKCSSLPCYLNVTLTPSNPILHTTRLKNVFTDYKPGVFYSEVPLFYEDWSDKSSEFLFKCDEEVQNICKNLNEFDLSYVRSLKIHYESPTPELLTKKIKSIAGFKGITSPTIKTECGFIPDLQSRYFIADFPYGLSILIQIADFLNLDVPSMKETLEWYRKIRENEKEFSYSNYGINTYKDFIEFYSI